MFNQLFRNIGEKCQVTFTNIFIYVSGGESGDLTTHELQFGVRKNAKKNLRPYLLQRKIIDDKQRNNREHLKRDVGHAKEAMALQELEYMVFKARSFA